MANVTIGQGNNATPPDGTIIATDPVGSVQYQIIKLDLGAPGASSPVSGTVPVSGSVTASGTVAVSSVAGSVAVTAAALPLPSGAAQDSTITANGVLLGALTETAPASDTASSGLNGRLQRIAQRLTSIIALLGGGLPAALGSGGGLKVDGSGTALPVSQSGTWNVGTLTSITNSVHVDDNAGSLTVDNAGTFAVQASQNGTWTIGNAAGASAVNIQDGGNSITVDGAVTVSGTVAATQSGTWAASTAAADGSSTEPSADLISGWDGLNVRSAFVQNVDGRNTLFTHDPTSRRLLEELLVEQRVANAQLARLLGPQALNQRDFEPGQRLMN